MSEEREFEVREHNLKGEYNKCQVCLKKFKLKEKVILCPIQEVREGWGSVMCLLIHTKCYYVENE